MFFSYFQVIRHHCQRCTYKCERKTSMSIHNLHCGVLKVRYLCVLCRQPYAYRYSLWRHHSKKHDGIDYSKYVVQGSDHATGK